MQTAAIYARVSTDWQAEHGYSLETQVSACEKYAADIARIYNLVKSCDGSFDAKKNIVHAIIASIDYERVDNTHKNGKYDIRFLIHFI